MSLALAPHFSLAAMHAHIRVKKEGVGGFSGKHFFPQIRPFFLQRAPRNFLPWKAEKEGNIRRGGREVFIAAP